LLQLNRIRVSGFRTFADEAVIEVIGALLWSLASYWLLSVLPFDFAHLADPLPVSLRFTLSWISKGLAKLLLALGAIVGAVQAIYMAVLLAVVRRMQ
jgi:hypothetical protein